VPTIVVFPHRSLGRFYAREAATGWSENPCRSPEAL
jgi:hypothetical protein